MSPMGSASLKPSKYKSGPVLARLRWGRGALRQKLILLGTLAVFVLQSYVVQTHIHFAASPDLGTIAASRHVDVSKANTASTPAHEKDRNAPSDDPARCPLCQEFLHAGHYLAPAPVLALLLTVDVAPKALLRAIAVTISPVSHDWHGRAPPNA